MATTAEKPAEQDPKKAAAVDTPFHPEPEKAGDGRTTLSQQATKPNDSAALGDLRTDARNTAEKHLPGVDLEHTKAPTLDRKTLEKSAEELHEALTRTKWLGMRDATDKDKVTRILAPMTEADRRAVEQIYEENYGDKSKAGKMSAAIADKSGLDHSSDFRSGALRATISEKFGGPQSVEQAQMLSLMNQSDGKTNDAGALMVAINRTREDSARGNVAIRAVFETLNEKQIKDLQENFRRDYGKSWQETLSELGSDLTPQTVAALNILRHGVDKKSAADVKALTNIAIEAKDPRLLGEALRGDSPAAIEARKDMLQDKAVLKRLMEAFPSNLGEVYGPSGIKRIVDASDANMHYTSQGGRQRQQQRDAMDLLDPVARDYLQEGRISLKTLTTENTGKWLFDNKENLELAARNASDSERKQFSLGRQLSAENRQPQSPEEKEAKDYYNKIHKVFTDRGSTRDVAIWEDQLSHGRDTVLTQMAKTHYEGWGPFSWGVGHSRQDMMSKAENLSEADWKLLRDPVEGKNFRKQIEAGLGTFADKGERDRVMLMLDEKAAKNTFDESKTVHRSLMETVKDNTGSYFLGMGTSYDSKNIINNLSSMSPLDANRLKTDSTFRQKAKDFIANESGFSPVEKLLAQRLMDKAAATGQVPKLDAQDTLLKMSAEGEKPEALLAQAQKALLEDQALRGRLSQSYRSMSESDRTVKYLIQDSYLASRNQHMPVDQYNASTRSDLSRFIASGYLSINDKVNLGFDKKSLIESAAGATPAERDAVRKRFSPEEQKLIDNVAANGGKASLADRVQMMQLGIIKDPAEFRAELEKMHSDKDGFVTLQKTKDEFTKKYGKDFDDVVLGKVDEKEKSAFKALLTPTESDGRQTFYDNVWKSLRSDSGASADGTYLTMQKSIDKTADSLEEYQRIYKTLPADKQKALDDYFNTALEQHKQSKEKLAEIVITATITAAALAAAPFTAGASVAALATYASIAAAGGAAFTVGAKMLITGNDYDKDHMLRDIVHGAVAGGLIFAIPPAGRVTALFAQGSKAVVTDAAVVTAMTGLAAAERAAVEKGLTQSLMQAGKAFGQREALEVVKSAAPKLGAEAQELLAREISNGVARNYAPIIEKGVVALQAEAEQAAKTTALRQFGKQVIESSAIGAGGNAVATIADAPFNKDGLDLRSLTTQTLVGATVGAVLPVVFKGVATGSRYVLNLSKELNAATNAAEVMVHPSTTGEPVKIQHADGRIETVTSKTPLRDGDQVVSGPPAKQQAATESIAGKTDAPASTSEANPNLKRNGNGELVNEHGKPVNEKGQLVNEHGKPVNEKGQLVNEHGKPVNERGQLVNEHGKPVNERGQLVNERGQVVDAEGRILDSKGNRIENEFPEYPASEFDRARPELVDDLHSWKSIEGNNVGEEFDRLSEKLGLSPQEKNQILDGLQTVREHGARMRDIDPEQAINWKHTQREFGAALDYASRNNLSKAETQDLLLSAMFSDGLKTKFNFTTHNVDGATAFEHFAKTHLAEMPAERIAGIKQAILEHQVAPPQFMAMIYSGAIAGSIKAEGRAMTDLETAALQSLKEKISNPFALKPADLIDVPGGPAGAKAVKLSPDEQALLRRTGLDHWYVPNEGNAWNKFSRGLIDADGIDNYAGPGGLSKIIGLRGPGKAVFFQDRHVLYGNPENASEISSVDSWKQSQRDFLGDPEKGKLGVATEQTRKYVEQQSARVESDILSAKGRVNEWINSAAGRKELGLPAEGAVDKIPGWTGTKEHPDLIDYPSATPQELERARKIWDRFGAELGAEQRVGLRPMPEYSPSMQSSAELRAYDETANVWNQQAKSRPDQVSLERAGTGENQWIIRSPDGRTAPLHAEITTNPDGSQTVKYITDQRADWYQKAYANGAPETAMTREVTYHPDGTVSTKGFDSDFVPAKGSTLRKDARFGEYWTSPDGKQTWIDGEKRIWNEAAQGVWHSRDGVLAENVEYVKRGTTTAKQLDEPLSWTNSYNGKESKMLAKPGDYKIDEGNGKFYVVDKEVFERTYNRAPGTEDQYVRKSIRAREAQEDQIIQTRAGDVQAKKGDYLVTGVDGEVYVVEKAKFHDLYERNAAQVNAKPDEAFKLPAVVGPGVEKPDGTYEMPHANGVIVWDKKNNIVTVTDRIAGTSSTWSGEKLYSQGFRVDAVAGNANAFTSPTRFYFNNGAEERITPSGLRLVHTPEMTTGEFRAEDGAVLKEAPRQKSSPITSEPLSFKPHTSSPDTTQIIDSEGRVWTSKDGNWVNDKGTLHIDENGYRFSWNDGRREWIDSEGRKWQASPEDKPGFWRDANGSSYQEGSWQYTKRTKDDAHDPEIIASLAPAGIALALGTKALSNQTESSSPDKAAAKTTELSSADRVAVASDGSWKAQLKDGRVVTPDSPGPWEVHLQNGTTLRRQANTLETRNADGSGKVTIYDAKGQSKDFELQAGGKYVDASGNALPFYSAMDTPPSSPQFEFKKVGTVKAELATEPFEWLDSHGNKMTGAAGDYRVIQPNGSVSSAQPDIFAKTYSPVPGQPGEFAKTAITRAQQLEADAAIPTLEGMGTGHKGDWVATGPNGERYIVRGKDWNHLYRAVEKPADASPMFEFQKKASVKAEKSTEPFPWTDWQGNPKTAKAGDWKVTQPDGTISSVEPSIFEKTYSEVPGKPGEYAKTAITKAQQLNEPTVINTKEGLGIGKKGDWMVTGPEGEQYIIEARKFDELYRSAAKPADASPMFEFQKKASVKAEKSTEPFPWTDWQGNPKTAKAGDWKVTQPDGTISSVEPSIFEKTYSEVPGKPGEYAKTAITKAQQLNEPTVINTKEGLGIGKRGDWLVTGPEGEQYIIEARKFDELYRPAPGNTPPPPFKIEVDAPKQDYIKTGIVKAEMVPHDGFKWINHDAAAGHQEQIAKKGDFMIYPADGGPPYVADGAFFRKAYHDMPGFPGRYAKTQTANAQVLDAPAAVNNPTQGITSGNKGDYLVTDKDGLQYIVPKEKFESQYAPQVANQKSAEPMHLPVETSEPQDMGAGVLHSTWEKGDIIRDTNTNKIFVQNKETGDYQWYQDGRLVEERRSSLSADGTKIQTIRYPYQDIESVSRLPSPQEYNEALLKTEYQGQTLAKVKDEAMQMPDTLKDKSIDPVQRKALQDANVEKRWDDLLTGNDATAKQLEFGPPKQEKKARILMGLTGSGKTSSGMADLKGKGYMVLESDELKPMFPEYKGGIGATALRNESNNLNDKLLERAVKDGYNFVLPGVGTNAQWMKDTIKQLSDAGWSVDLVFVDIPPAESMSRVVSRFQKEGRFVDPGFLVTHGHVPAENYRRVVDDMFTNGSGLSAYRHVWNYGERPITLEEGRIERAATGN